MLQSAYTNNWNTIVSILTDSTWDKKMIFCVRYAFQATIYAVWREQNKRWHGEQPLPVLALKKFIDKGIRNKFSLVRSKGGKGVVDIL